MSGLIQQTALIGLSISLLIGVYFHYYGSKNEKCLANSDCSDGDICVQGSCLNEAGVTLSVCQLIKKKSPRTKVLYPSDVGYDESINHYAVSSTQRSLCSVLPSTSDDVATILKFIGKYRVHFAIKGGGHSLNPGFSSTKGIHISMSRFNHVIYHEKNGTVDIGSGLIWDDVFKQLEPYNISVVGGRISGVGVGGLLLGGGYSWKSNQYGLSIDNIYGYELVTPDGEIVNVNKDSYPDIFFGLKGGFNNFGIVTNFNVRAIPQGEVYSGILHYTKSEFDAVIKAIENFQNNNKDPKAELIAFLMGKRDTVKITVNLFYDGPTDINGVFNELLSIKHVGTVQSQSLLSFINSTFFTAVHNKRGRTTTVSVEKITARFIYGLVDHFKYLDSTLGSKQGAGFFVTLEPYVSTFLNHAQDGAYPHSSSTNPLLPLLIAFIWDREDDDVIFVDEIKSTYDKVFQIAIDDGQNVNPLKQIHYPNYASEHLSLSQLYGSNLERLRNIRKSWDKNNVMYLTGGYKF